MTKLAKSAVDWRSVMSFRRQIARMALEDNSSPWRDRRGVEHDRERGFAGDDAGELSWIEPLRIGAIG